MADCRDFFTEGFMNYTIYMLLYCLLEYNTLSDITHVISIMYIIIFCNYVEMTKICFQPAHVFKTIKELEKGKRAKKKLVSHISK